MCRTHIIQRNLRPPGGKGYAIPRGFGFDYITCANYTFEIYGWILFASATWTLPALLFITAGAAQMAIWAKAKHARLRKVTHAKVPHVRLPECSSIPGSCRCCDICVIIYISAVSETKPQCEADSALWQDCSS